MPGNRGDGAAVSSAAQLGHRATNGRLHLRIAVKRTRSGAAGGVRFEQDELAVFPQKRRVAAVADDQIPPIDRIQSGDESQPHDPAGHRVAVSSFPLPE